MNEQHPAGEAQKSQKKTFYKKWWFITIVVVVLLLIISSFGEDKDKKKSQTKTDNQTSEQTNTDNKSEKNDSTPLLGDEFILKYDGETDEKIFIVDTEENYIAFVKSSVMKDTEGSIEISKKHVISIDNGTRVRVIRPVAF